MSELANKIVVVTGASAGVGRATAVEFARQGATVALLARGKAGLEGARAEVEAAGGQGLGADSGRGRRRRGARRRRAH